MSFTLATSLMASNYAGHTKKTTATAIIYVGWAAGLIAGPRKFFQFLLGMKNSQITEFFLTSQAPNYQMAFEMLSETTLFIKSTFLTHYSGVLCAHDYRSTASALLLHP
jgi:hypothetical protein